MGGWRWRVGGHRCRISLPGVGTHKLINLVLMEDLDTQSARSAAAIFHPNDIEADATGVPEGLSGPHRLFFTPLSFIERETHF